MKNLKRKVLALALFATMAAGMSACAYKTCPTYAKADQAPAEKAQTETALARK